MSVLRSDEQKMKILMFKIFPVTVTELKWCKDTGISSIESKEMCWQSTAFNLFCV
jgi:hypothetical protein